MSPSHEIVDAVSSAEGVGPTDLPPLFEAIDPEALDALFRSDADVEVTFDYQGYEVTVRDGANVVVRRLEPSS